MIFETDFKHHDNLVKFFSFRGGKSQIESSINFKLG